MKTATEEDKREKFIREVAVEIFLERAASIPAKFAVDQATALYDELKKKQKELEI